MAWTFDSPQITRPVVKQNGLCRREGMHKYCPYWVARHTPGHKDHVLGYRCQLFNADKTGYAAIEACNVKYGLNYDGPPIP